MIGITMKPEVVGANWLRKSFLDEVSEPVRLHVPAKRYLCATRPGYWEELSEGSKISLKKQGGPMTDIECSHFEELSGYQEAIKLREFDDQAKVVGMAIDSIHSFNDAVLDALRAATPA
ncbi:MAG: phosphohydrolase [Gammaproteobacteria bacterium]|nr:phosphohydrolase [Gammaproteobacteria bacterium]